MDAAKPIKTSLKCDHLYRVKKSKRYGAELDGIIPVRVCENCLWALIRVTDSFPKHTKTAGK